MAKRFRVQWVEQQLHDDPRLQCLPKSARADAEGDILTTIYLRTIKNRRRISCPYIAKTVRYYLHPRRRGDPYVERLRRLAVEFQRRGERVAESLMENRRSTLAPIDELIQREEDEAVQVKLMRIHNELKQLGARSREVIVKFLRGEALTHAERCVKHRAVVTLNSRLSDQF